MSHSGFGQSSAEVIISSADSDTSVFKDLKEATTKNCHILNKNFQDLLKTLESVGLFPEGKENLPLADLPYNICYKAAGLTLPMTCFQRRTFVTCLI